MMRLPTGPEAASGSEARAVRADLFSPVQHTPGQRLPPETRDPFTRDLRRTTRRWTSTSSAPSRCSRWRCSPPVTPSAWAAGGSASQWCSTTAGSSEPDATAAAGPPNPGDRQPPADRGRACTPGEPAGHTARRWTSRHQALTIGPRTPPTPPTPLHRQEEHRPPVLVFPQVGGRGTGGFAGLPLGSVAAQLAAHASGTVTVVRGTADSAGAVVVGVEGFADDAALEHAFRFASRHGLSVRALHVLRPRVPVPSISVPVYPTAAGRRQEAVRMVTRVLAPCAAKFPDVAARPTVVVGHPAGALVQASRGSALLVVGGRGRGSFTRTFWPFVDHLPPGQRTSHSRVWSPVGRNGRSEGPAVWSGPARSLTTPE